MKTKKELRKAHGTPAEFERAVWRAWQQLLCTTKEAMKSINDYRKEYEAAQ